MTGRLARFGLAGLANTALGYAVIVLALVAGLGDYAANAAGYLAGFALSFALNRRFTFGIRGGIAKAEIARFLLAIAAAYAVNLAVLTIARTWLGAENALAQLPAILAYAATFYVLSVHFVFPRRSRA